jgi:tetraacyldisaccharide 4'-kinase
MSFRDRLVASWYASAPTPLALALAPLSLLFGAMAAVRRALYRMRVVRAAGVGVPVVVVGNLTAGGAGKTPLADALARALSRRGYVPGIVSRGYGRRDARRVTIVTPAADPRDVGDEPLVLARRGWPIAVGADRAGAARALLSANPRCNVVICDDGLQHYALARDVEIAVVDGARGLGNGLLLPAGPLREPRSRLADVDAVVTLASAGAAPDVGVRAFAMTLAPGPLRRVGAAGVQQPVATFAGVRVHAIAGIGNPDRFFRMLETLGMVVARHPFPDHHAYGPTDLAFADGAPIVMTEKDAVKCERFADERCWYVPVDATIDPALVERVVEKLTWTRSSSKSSSVRSPRAR